MVLLIDNYDSFTYNLYQYYLKTGVDCQVLRNDVVEIGALAAMNPQLIVISPGPGGPEATGRCLEIIERYGGQIPIFGVCLGLQTLASAAGASIIKARAPVHGKLSKIEHDEQGVFANVPSPFQVTRYNSLVVDPETVPVDWSVSARSSDGEIMGMRQEALRIEGVQFHPEALLTEHGHPIVENSLKL
jgi:anthranilate synthase/aminodeoxychorismate synthase-like glutamine amidotransferase|tara:strand:- start:4917 stop:5480 length:564 start_codon:yes stop_codon:yes gene_type:complete